jgi:hypothetical protein
MEGQGVIIDDNGYTWAECDCCGFAMGVGFGCGLEEAKKAFKDWGWKYEGGRTTCCFCVEEGRKA